MLLPLELGIVVTLFLGGSWSRRVAVVFLPVVGVSLTLLLRMKYWLLGAAIGITAFLVTVFILLMFYYRPTFEWAH
jgi:hypothetical protein